MFAKEEFNIYALSLDPVYIGTGGYTIGRVDNTIVRDTITKIPKIPATSLAGTWRYYTALTLQGFFKEKFEDIRKILNYNDTVTPRDVRELVNRLADKHLKDEERNKFAQRMNNFQKYANRIKEEMQENKNQTAEQSDSIEWKLYWGNLISSIKCAGQDDKPNDDIEDVTQKELRETGHCGHCIVCKAFGFSKNESQQGLIFFSDLNILFFPVNTRFGVRWITSPSLLRE
ncbi:MAG TPA: hypothetical protein GX503_00460, partial [Clostridiales bacterium]|nr:hypothetical protein [Clostridiales bacterium]